MLTAVDLRAAVAAGVITEEQARQLGSRAAPEMQRRLPWWHELDDIWIALGVGLFGSLLSLVGAWAAAIGFWIAGEFTMRRSHLPLPAMIACSGFAAALAGTALIAADILAADPFSLPIGARATALLAAMAALAGTLAFSWRFRLPFAALVTVACIAVGLTVAGDVAAGRWAEEQAGMVGPAVTLLCGLVSLTVAVLLDRRDPSRVGQASATGFWLHLASAPLIAHTVLYGAAALAGAEVPILHPGYTTAVLGLWLFLAGMAVVLDRPAYFVGGFAYLLVALGHGMSRLDFEALLLTWTVLSMLFAGMVWLGIRWHTVRRAVLRLSGVLSDSRRPPSFEA